MRKLRKRGATQLQRLVRGFTARRRFAVIKAKHRLSRGFVPRVRRWQEWKREEVRRQQREALALHCQRIGRGFMTRKRIYGIRADAAAELIQAVIRGFLDRCLVRRIHEELFRQKQVAMATKIASFARMLAARRVAEDLRYQRDFGVHEARLRAAIGAQRAWRGFYDRWELAVFEGFVCKRLRLFFMPKKPFEVQWGIIKMRLHIKMQAVARGFLDRRRLQQAMALRLGRIWRGYHARWKRLTELARREEVEVDRQEAEEEFVQNEAEKATTEVMMWLRSKDGQREIRTLIKGGLKVRILRGSSTHSTSLLRSISLAPVPHPSCRLGNVHLLCLVSQFSFLLTSSSSPLFSRLCKLGSLLRISLSTLYR